MIAPFRILCPWQEPDKLAFELIKEWGESGLIWLDGDGSQLSRWVTLATNPIEYICCRGLPNEKKASNPFNALRNLNAGHWTGWLSYEAGAWIEPSCHWKMDSMATLWIASHDPVLKFDLKKHELWLEGSSKESCEELFRWLKKVKNKNSNTRRKPKEIPVNSWEWSTDNTTFAKNVNLIKKLIESGDIFQANLSACCTTAIPTEISAADIFYELRKTCSAPFAGLIIGSGEASGEAIISSSPERFLRVLPNGKIETRPIKGTRPRNIDPIIDSNCAADLISNAKDRAENIMIVDLLRNDLGKVCQPGSIKVSKLLGLESFKQVHHLTSVIEGELQSNKSWVDALEACWPGGSITGAPKIRACQRLNEIEPIARGPYCGSLLNLGWNKVFDSNILIRSFMLKDLTLRAHAGCGIVADSDATQETEELKWKIMPLIQALAR